MKILTVKTEDRIPTLKPGKETRHLFIGTFDSKKKLDKKGPRRWIVLTDVIVFLDEGPAYMDHINLYIKNHQNIKDIRPMDIVAGHSNITLYARKNKTISCGFNHNELEIFKPCADMKEQYKQIFYKMYYE